MRLLITGALGFVGVNLVRWLASARRTRRLSLPIFASLMI